MAPEDLDKLIERYLEGNCTQEECDFVDAWYASLGNPPKHPVSPRKLTALEARILDSIHARTGGTVPEKRRPMFAYYSGIAASLLICLAAGYYLLQPDPTGPVAPASQTQTADFTLVENNTTASRRAILPDGSIAVLSPHSIIRYPNGDQHGARELFLEGEAYFDVAHNAERPFFVYAGNVITRVLGTSFIVSNRGEHETITVAVKTGKVTVYSRKAAHKKTVLTPNQEAVYDKATDLLATQAVPAERQDEEKKRIIEMHFEETPVPDVLSTLVKTYDIDIVFQKEMLSGCVLTSSFFEEGLYDRIDVICTAIGATYKIVDKQIVIESKGCNLKPS